MNPKLIAFQKLLDTMDELREKCPWDRKQTMESLRILTIEETYELADAIIAGNMEEVKKELGDIILHIVFYAKIAEEKQEFNITDVCESVVEKLIRRHPHIYGDVKVKDEQEVKENWEAIKQKEGHKSVLSGVPPSLPSLVKASRLQEKAAFSGFDWDKKSDVWRKVKEEMLEFEEQLNAGKINKSELEAEFGDLLFSMVNYARFIGVNPDNALEKTNQKFISRFKYIEEQAGKMGKKVNEMTLEEMDQLWNEVKKKK